MSMEKANATARASAVVWRPYFITLPGNVPRSKYHHTAFSGFVVIVDGDGPKSVTNDAERVVREMYAFHSPSLGHKFRILYRDTQGDWDELVHKRGVFVNFAPLVDNAAAMVAHEVQKMLP